MPLVPLRALRNTMDGFPVAGLPQSLQERILSMLENMSNTSLPTSHATESEHMSVGTAPATVEAGREISNIGGVSEAGSVMEASSGDRVVNADIRDGADDTIVNGVSVFHCASLSAVCRLPCRMAQREVGVSSFRSCRGS